MSIKSKLLTLILLFSSFQQAKADGPELNGLDLNPILFGCIMSGSKCLDDTGISLLDTLFSRENVNMDHYHTYEYKTYYYNSAEYWNFDNSRGPIECRAVKEAYYLKKTGFDPIPARDEGYQRQEHLNRYDSRKGPDSAFECNDKQRGMFIKAKIGKK